MRIVILTTDNREPHKDYNNPVPHFGTAPSALLQGLALIPEIEVHVVSCIRRPVSSPEKIAPNIYFHSPVVPQIGWMKTLFQGCIRAARKKIREIAPDIVHGQGAEADCGVSAIFSGFPNVLTLHGNMRAVARAIRARPFSYNWMAARLETVTLLRTQGVVCISSYTQRQVAGLAKRTWLLPNAVDAAFFDVAAEPSGSRTVLCVANVGVYKNQNLMMEALDPLARTGDFKLRFLGAASPETPYGAAFLEMVRARPWCEFGGKVGRAELRAELQQAAALILPSLEDNCPMVILEAMAAGVPVAGARIGGIPDLIEHGTTGLLFDPRSPAEIRQAAAILLDEPANARRMAVTARDNARERFLPEVIARRHVEIYREVLGA